MGQVAKRVSGRGKQDEEVVFKDEEDDYSIEEVTEEDLLPDPSAYFDEVEVKEEEDEEDTKSAYIEYAKKVQGLPENLVGLHPAEIAAMYPASKDGKIGGSDEQILKDLRRLVFSVPLMPHQKVRETFLELDKKMFPVIHDIVEASAFFHEELVQVVIKVAAGNTYGKNIYEKENAPLPEEAPKERDLYKDHEIEFLLNSYDLLNTVTASRTKPLKPIPISVERCLFIRGVYEEILEGFIGMTKDLEELHWLAYQAKISGSGDKYEKYLAVIKGIEEKLGIRQSYFGLIRQARAMYGEFQNARARVISPYLRSVYSTAKKTAKNAHQMLDNFQNGSIGLIRAVSCYSTRRPASFHSVAKWWIKQMMLLSIKEDANFVKLPVSTWQAYTQLEKAKVRIGAADDDIENIAKAANIAPKKAKAVYDTVKIAQVYSLNRTYDQDEKLSLEDIMTDENKIGYEGDDVSTFLREYCALAKLTPLEIKVLALKNGMLDLLEPVHVNEQEVLREAFVQNLAILGYNFKPAS